MILHNSHNHGTANVNLVKSPARIVVNPKDGKPDRRDFLWAVEGWRFDLAGFFVLGFAGYRAVVIQFMLQIPSGSTTAFADGLSGA